MLCPEIASTQAPITLLQAARDDHFRAELRKDPARALARHGIQLSPESIPAGIELPDKETIECAFDSGGVGPWSGFFT